MTTKAAEKFYEEQHAEMWNGRKIAVYNPHNKPVDELPIIYGFNNGGEPGWMHGDLMAEDGTSLGSHICTSVGYMPHDLGVLEGSRPDRHEDFKKHYPDGYRMQFVESPKDNPGLMLAYERNQALAKAYERNEALARASEEAAKNEKESA